MTVRVEKQHAKIDSPSWAIERYLLQVLYRRLGRPKVDFTLWDGYRLGTEGVGPNLFIHHRRAFWRLLIRPDLHFGEDYTRGTLSIEGGLLAFLEAIYFGRARVSDNQTSKQHKRAKLRPLYSIKLRKAKQNASHHYDMGNDFYRLWLDKDMVYTCAYFPQVELNIEQAQQAKMEHICRKLQLKAGETVFEAGCGWGALSLYMARHYGVKVKAYNVSAAQIKEARRRAKAQGLEHAVEFIEDDYRTIQGQCDAFVSVGMLEHVGPSNYTQLGEVIDRTLAAYGRGLIHSIAQNQPDPTSPWIQKYIFPDGYSPTLREMMDIFEPMNLSIVDLENLRLHYAMTLRHWLRRFEAHRDEIAAMYDEDFVRMWRLYLCGSIANFTTGNLQLYQILFQRPDLAELPITRAHLYR